MPAEDYRIKSDNDPFTTYWTGYGCVIAGPDPAISLCPVMPAGDYRIKSDNDPFTTYWTGYGCVIAGPDPAISLCPVMPAGDYRIKSDNDGFNPQTSPSSFYLYLKLGIFSSSFFQLTELIFARIFST